MNPYYPYHRVDRIVRPEKLYDISRNRAAMSFINPAAGTEYSTTFVVRSIIDFPLTLFLDITYQLKDAIYDRMGANSDATQDGG